MLPGMKELTYDQRLRSLNLGTLRFRRYSGDMIEVFKIMKGIYDKQCLPPLRLKNELGRTRGHSLQLQRRRSRLELSRNTFCHRVIPIWNSLPQEMVDARNINQFKNKIDRLWFNKKCKFDYHYDIFDKKDIA